MNTSQQTKLPSTFHAQKMKDPKNERQAHFTLLNEFEDGRSYPINWIPKSPTRKQLILALLLDLLGAFLLAGCILLPFVLYFFIYGF